MHDFARHFDFHPSRGIAVFRLAVVFFPSRVIFPVHFPTVHVAFDNGHTAIAAKVKRRGIRPI